MSLKTNILRLQAQGICYSYQAIFSATVNEEDAFEVEHYVETLDNNIIYSHPYLYTNQPLNTDSLTVLLSKGSQVQIKLQYIKEQNKISILGLVCQKILKCLQFLPYRKIKTHFNPFQQKNNVLPGLYLEPVFQQTYNGIAFLPVNLFLEPANEISSSKILLNHTTGEFIEKSEIVRVDKQKNIIHLRNGSNISLGNLKKGNIKDVVGLELAQKLRNYSQRVRQSCKQFFENWQIKLETSFFNNTASLISIGTIALRNGIEKQLFDIVNPMARNSYNHNFRQMFKNNVLQGHLEAQIFFIMPAELSKGKQAKKILQQFESLSQKMSFNLKTEMGIIQSLESQQQMKNLINNCCQTNLKIYTLVTTPDMTLAQEECVKLFKSQMIKRGFYFHIMPFDFNEETDEIDIVALRNVATLFCKMRLIPWKLKNIPFGDKPTIVCNIDVQETSNGDFSVAIVSSMNAFFSKFCCYQSICPSQKIHFTIYNLLQQAINKFCSVHKIYPIRVFIFRTGFIDSLQQQHKSIQTRLANFYVTVKNTNRNNLSYIRLSQSHPFRSYIQTDENYVSRHTVKKTQLLTCTFISGRYYLQLEFEEPPMEINILEPQNDPSFIPKVLQLTAKLCYGSVGNQFGKGKGFLSYAQKLNSYRDFNLTPWNMFLQQGVMLFL